MAAALNAFIEISKAEGEARPGIYGMDRAPVVGVGHRGETSWTQAAARASASRARARCLGARRDRSSHLILGYICTGSSFPHIDMHKCKGVGTSEPQVHFKIHMEEAFITKATQKAAEDGGVPQTVEMVFKTIHIDYAKQGTDKNNPGKLDAFVSYDSDIPAGKASPATGA